MLFHGAGGDEAEDRGAVVEYSQRVLVQGGMQDPTLVSLLSRVGALVPRNTAPPSGDLQEVMLQNVMQNASAIQNLENASSQLHQNTLQALQNVEQATLHTQQATLQALHQSTSHENQLQHTFQALQHMENIIGQRELRDETLFQDLKMGMAGLRQTVAHIQEVMQSWGGLDTKFATTENFLFLQNEIQVLQQKIQDIPGLWTKLQSHEKILQKHEAALQTQHDTQQEIWQKIERAELLDGSAQLAQNVSALQAAMENLTIKIGILEATSGEHIQIQNQQTAGEGLTALRDMTMGILEHLQQLQNEVHVLKQHSTPPQAVSITTSHEAPTAPAGDSERHAEPVPMPLFGPSLLPLIADLQIKIDFQKKTLQTLQHTTLSCTNIRTPL